MYHGDLSNPVLLEHNSFAFPIYTYQDISNSMKLTPFSKDCFEMEQVIAFKLKIEKCIHFPIKDDYIASVSSAPKATRILIGRLKIVK